jgi:CBS domain containing-hemolysin-like protein
MWRLSILLTVALPMMWVQRRLWPWWLEAFARWDCRAAGHAKARSDKDAAIAHLERAEYRLSRAICAVRES